jgi:hypothetical protein
MKYFLIWAFLNSSGGLSITTVAEFNQMRPCLEMKKELKAQKGKWAKGAFNCVWVKG